MHRATRRLFLSVILSAASLRAQSKDLGAGTTPALVPRWTKGGRARAHAVCRHEGTRVPTRRSFDFAQDDREEETARGAPHDIPYLLSR